MNRTPKISLSQFEANDTPKWLQDYNGDMDKIDTAVGALDAEISNMINRVYPVGSIYESVVNTSPASLFGGTWTTLGAGCVLVGSGTSDKTYAISGETWVSGRGQSENRLTESQMPSHDGHIDSWGGNEAAAGRCLPIGSLVAYGTGRRGWSCQSLNEAIPAHKSIGGTTPVDNMPPYVVVYRWRRTA